MHKRITTGRAKWLLSGTILALSLIQCKSKNMEYYMLIGTYTHTDSKGIYVMKFNSETGEIKEVSTQGGIANPSYLTIHGDNVYAVSETNGDVPGSLNAYHFAREKGTLQLLNTRETRGEDPCYVETDKTGRFVAVANYSSGSLALFRTAGDGSLNEGGQFIRHTGGSVDTSRQSGPHVHETVFSHNQKYLNVVDLGKDQLLVYHFDPRADEPLSFDRAVESRPGTGPRHVWFHPSLPVAYVIHEMIPWLTVYNYADDNYTEIQNIKTWPEGFEGNRDGAELKTSTDGKFLYVSHRGDQHVIGVYAIDQQTGEVTLKDTVPAGGKGPRDFEIDPTGNFLLVANQGTDNIVVFKRNQATGLLARSGEINIPIPVCIKFTPVKCNN